MVWNGGRPSHRPEEDGVKSRKCLLPVSRHHLAMTLVIVTGGKVIGCQIQPDAKPVCGGLEHPQAFGDYLLANAITR